MVVVTVQIHVRQHVATHAEPMSFILLLHAMVAVVEHVIIVVVCRVIIPQ